jgi:Mrp family chromosome partitioning ATPase
VVNSLDSAFLNLGRTQPVPEAPSPGATEDSDATASRERVLHQAEGLTWPGLVEELVKFAAGRFHGVGERLLQSAARGDKRIALASCHPREGRTTVALALGRWFSGRHRGRRLLLVDADVQSADLSRRVGLTGGMGISDLVSGSAARPCEQLAVPAGLSVLGAGGRLGGDAVADSAAWELLAEWLRSQFDLVLVDTGAALAEGFGRGDARRLAEAVLWIRDPQRTSLSELCEAQRQIAVASLGVIENLVPPERLTLERGERQHRIDSAAEMHVHVHRLPGNGVAKNV